MNTRAIAALAGRLLTLRFAGLLVAGVLAASPVMAELQLRTEAFREIEVTTKAGKKEKQLQAISNAVPGQEVVYVITYRNSGATPAARVVVSNPLPAGLVYQPGSAQGAGTRPEVSVDGGKQFGPLPQLTVRNTNGTVRAARAEDVTHVRWTVLQDVGPAAQGSVTYRAVLK